MGLGALFIWKCLQKAALISTGCSHLCSVFWGDTGTVLVKRCKSRKVISCQRWLVLLSPPQCLLTPGHWNNIYLDWHKKLYWICHLHASVLYMVLFFFFFFLKILWPEGWAQGHIQASHRSFPFTLPADLCSLLINPKKWNFPHEKFASTSWLSWLLWSSCGSLWSLIRIERLRNSGGDSSVCLHSHQWHPQHATAISFQVRMLWTFIFYSLLSVAWANVCNGSVMV